MELKSASFQSAYYSEPSGIILICIEAIRELEL